MIARPWPHIDRLRCIAARSDLPAYTFDTRPRSEGLHLSTLYHALYPKELNDVTETDLQTYGILGLAMEDRLERAFAVLAEELDLAIERPTEIVSEEGIIGSPDLFVVGPPPTPLVIGELKAPWKSSRGCPVEESENGFPDKFNVYFSQLMAYMHIMDTLQGLLIIYFVNGDWSRRPPVPQLLGWELEFSEQERAENWDALICCAMEMR